MQEWCYKNPGHWLVSLFVGWKQDNSEVLPKPRGPLGGADLHFGSPQPYTSSNCETADTGIVHRVVCLFTAQPLGRYQIMLLDAQDNYPAETRTHDLLVSRRAIQT